jgi:hypothetical protein
MSVAESERKVKVEKAKGEMDVAVTKGKGQVEVAQYDGRAEADKTVTSMRIKCEVRQECLIVHSFIHCIIHSLVDCCR